MNKHTILILLLVVLALASCGPEIDDTTPEPTISSGNQDPADSPIPPTSAPVPATSAPIPATGAAAEVTYFTPAQQEGPYYPLEKPADRDNDLLDLAGAGEAPAGEVLYLAGIVYDADGQPVEGALIEIWQTDASGVYQHPDDPGTDGRDPNFQFYGESLTGADGVYSFRTILPGRYEPRPRHIHVKVKMDGQELLTTQFYFGSEVNFSGDEANLVADMAPAKNDAGDPIWVAERDIVLSAK